MGAIRRFVPFMLVLVLVMVCGLGPSIRAQEPEYHQGPLRMCPLDMKLLHLRRFDNQYVAKQEWRVHVYAINPEVAQVRASTATRENPPRIEIQAGPNETDQAKRTTVYIEVWHVYSGNPENSVLDRDKDVYRQEVVVLPQRQCKDKAQENEPTSIMHEIGQTVPLTPVDPDYMGELMRLCVGETTEISSSLVDSKSTATAFFHVKSSDPGVVDVVSNQFTGHGFLATLMGKREGMAQVTAKIGGGDIDLYGTVATERYAVKVRECRRPQPETQPENVLPGTTGTPAPSGTETGTRRMTGDGSTPATPPQDSETDKPDSDTEQSFVPGFNSTKHVAHGLASSIFNTPYGNVVVHLPEAMAAGDPVTGTVMLQPAGSTPQAMAQNAAALSQYKVHVESVAVFSDGPPKPFELQLPGTPGETDGETTVVLTDEQGKAVGQVPFQVPSVLPQIMQAASGFQLPQTHIAGEPIQCHGNFDGRFANTKLTVNGQPTIKLAESPHGMVAINPNETVGTGQSVTLSEGSTVITGKIDVLPPASPTATGQQPGETPESEQPGETEQPGTHSFPAGNLGTPSRTPMSQPDTGAAGAGAGASQEQQEQAESPVKQMIRQMCDNTLTLYKQNLDLMVDEGWKAPKPPRKGTWTAVLEYEVTKTGTVQNIRVIQPSGYAPIDESARARVMQMSGQIRPVPSCYDKPALPVTHRFKVIYR